jgi:hypothetical protein
VSTVLNFWYGEKQKNHLKKIIVAKTCGWEFSRLHLVLTSDGTGDVGSNFFKIHRTKD